jgi:hypothetical protein
MDVMLVTEAKEKICPFISGGVVIPKVSVYPTTKLCACQANDCMAWVWDEAIQEENKPETLQNIGGYCARLKQ